MVAVLVPAERVIGRPNVSGDHRRAGADTFVKSLTRRRGKRALVLLRTLKHRAAAGHRALVQQHAKLEATMESLDTILSGREPASATEKQDTTTAAVDTTAEQTTEQTTETTETEQTGEPGKAPIGAIRQAEREKATKRYTEQVADFEKKLVEREQAWERRFGQLLEKVGPPKPEPKPAPDIFENAPEAILHTVNPHLQRLEERQYASDSAVSRLAAIQEFGADVVKEADVALSQAVQAGQVSKTEIGRIPPGELYQRAVQWHQQQQRLAPDFEEKLKAKHFAEFQQQNGGLAEQAPAAQQQQRSAVMPSNLATARNVGARSGPAWAGPTPLKDIFRR